MRGAKAGLLILGMLGSPLAAQTGAPPKPTPPAAAKPEPPSKPGTPPLVSKALEPKFAPGLVPFSTSGNLSREDLETLDSDAYRLEIRDITVKEFFERIKGLHLFSTLVIKDNLGEALMPVSVIKVKDLKNYILQLDQYTDSVEVKMTEQMDGSAIVVSGKTESGGKPNILFVPVNLEPLLAGIQGGNEKDLADKKTEKIKNIQRVIEQGVELDTGVRGLKTPVALKMMVHPETNLLFLAGQTEQVEAASKILSVLGARIPTLELGGGGWGMGPGGTKSGVPGMGVPGSGSGPKDRLPGMSSGLPLVPGSSQTYSVPLPGAGNGRIQPGAGSTNKPQNQNLPGLPDPGTPVPAAGGELPGAGGLPVGR